jgi:WS/DGAT/MGAT family acyltransferase
MTGVPVARAVRPVHADPGRIDRVPVPDLCCLWAEEPATTPMIIALAGTVEGGSLTDASGQELADRVRRHVAARLHRAPKLRRMLLPTRLGQGSMAWIDAPSFDIAQHVTLAEPPDPVDEAGFLDWCAQRSILPIDRSRPLWRIDVIPGLPRGRIGLLVAVHHVVADGLRGVAMMTGLFDPTPEAGGPDAVPPWQPRPAPTGAELIGDNLRRRTVAVRRMIRGLPELPARLRTIRALATETRARAAPAPALAGPVGSRRRMTVIRLPLAELRRGAHARDVTINDVLLAAVTTGLRDLLSAQGDCPENLVLRASVPVGARDGGAGGMIVAPLPVGVQDPDTRLRLVREETRRRKRHPDEGIAAMLTMPPGLARLGVLWAKHTATSHINLYVTNVPGPSQPLHLAGARLLDVAPLAPLVAGVPLSVTALSYHDVLAVSLLADPSAVDLTALDAGVRHGFRDYLHA